eukprot:CAMPEP_0174272798 /NCGR_PEP_ID=MMETSP0439-20130205/52485_1 /TAXON_ID=0 /ORGANISM="Stereomyxa ramosa, Strain Chinc5" /LENGTH=34 /DNA_ID= /DNA_START= /DNA_END= /DNA_ORIENTATION=
MYDDFVLEEGYYYMVMEKGDMTLEEYKRSRSMTH